MKSNVDYEAEVKKVYPNAKVVTYGDMDDEGLVWKIIYVLGAECTWGGGKTNKQAWKAAYNHLLLQSKIF